MENDEKKEEETKELSKKDLDAITENLFNLIIYLLKDYIKLLDIAESFGNHEGKILKNVALSKHVVQVLEGLRGARGDEEEEEK